MMKLLTTLNVICSVVISLSAYAAGRDAEPNNMKTIGPPSVKVSCGDILIRIDGTKMWTIRRIEYKGTLLGIEDSEYGTVLTFPGIGHIGVGHTVDRPDGAEEVRVIEFYLDGKRIQNPPDAITGTNFRLVKKSHILNTNIENITEMRADRIYETAVLKTTKEVPLNQAYHFMHAWTPTATAFLAHAEDGKELEDVFGNDQRKEYGLGRIVWIAVYDVNSGKGAISYVIEKSAEGGADLLIVNAPGVYRKCYLRTFANKTVPADFNGRYRMVTRFFETPADKWQDAARKLATEQPWN
jgi:hypothetical protein